MHASAALVTITVSLVLICDLRPAHAQARQGSAIRLSLPMRFEANAGQTDRSVRFFSRSAGYTLFLTPAEAVFAFRQASDQSSAVLRMTLRGARQPSTIEGLALLPGTSNYYTSAVRLAAVPNPLPSQ